MRKAKLILLGSILSLLAIVSMSNAVEQNTLMDITYSDLTKDARKQVDCLAENIYHEAGYEPFEGKVAVAQVTINRAESGSFPSDICQVVYQKNIVYEKVLCQFSWYCETASRAKPIHNAAYRESQEVAKKVLLEGFRLPSLENAMYYHADYINPKWNKERVAKIGAHIFYSDNPSKGK